MSLVNTKLNIRKNKQPLPYKRYLECLVAANIQISDIINNLKDLELYPLPTDIESEVRTIMSDLSIKFPNSDFPSVVKSMVNYIQGLPGGKVSFGELFEFVNDKTIRRWVQPMLLGNLDISTVYITTSLKTDKMYDEGTYQLFQTYFFDLSDFTSREKYIIVNLETDAKMKDLYDLALKYDKDELLWKMGFTPDIPIDKIVKSVAAEGIMRMKNSVDDDKAARLGTLALKAAEKLKDLTEEQRKDAENAAGLNFDLLTTRPSFKTPKDLENE